MLKTHQPREYHKQLTKRFSVTLEITAQQRKTAALHIKLTKHFKVITSRIGKDVGKFNMGV